ncbi:MAG: hypothetical protein DME43_16095 [Verrucomicrobia bacterium]|nr:MAG: hypothetical protein DME43_16095 [Verrucomicrobiota bacterium]
MSTKHIRYSFPSHEFSSLVFTWALQRELPAVKVHAKTGLADHALLISQRSNRFGSLRGFDSKPNSKTVKAQMITIGVMITFKYYWSVNCSAMA